MELETRKEGEVLVVKSLEKRLAAHIAAEFRERLAQLINEGNHLIVLDISEVEFIDSAGLAALVYTLKLLGRKEQLVIYGARGPVTNIFELTRMNTVFQMFDDEKGAIAALSG